MENVIKIAVIGAGIRGSSLARHVNNYDNIAKIVAVADPSTEVRERFVQNFKIKKSSIFNDWRELIHSPLEYDAVIIATLDNAHTEPAITFLQKGCHALIEKPMADTSENCRKILQAQKKSGKILAVSHTLRFMDGFRHLKEIIEQNTIGKIITVNQMEDIGNLRFSHNYVRGKWANDKANTYLLLHKSCHDIDYMAWLINSKCKSVSSFGKLSYFNKENAPQTNTNRCTDNCSFEPTCPYSAKKLYTQGNLEEWPSRDVSKIHTYQAHLKAIRTGPYGLCVWNANNNVVDHQVVAMEFENGATATFTMSGFTSKKRRSINIQGTKGEINFDDLTNKIVISKFIDNSTKTINIKMGSEYHPEDDLIVQNFLTAVKLNKKELIAVDGHEAYEKLKIVFAAEQSRLQGSIVKI